MTELRVWIPTKTQIEGLLQEVLDKLKAAKTISDVPEDKNFSFCPYCESDDFEEDEEEDDGDE